MIRARGTGNRVYQAGVRLSTCSSGFFFYCTRAGEQQKAKDDEDEADEYENDEAKADEEMPRQQSQRCGV